MLPSPPDAAVLEVVLSGVEALQTPVPDVPKTSFTLTLEQVTVIAEAGIVVQVPPVKVDVADETPSVQVLLAEPRTNPNVIVEDADPATELPGVLELKLMELGETARLLMLTAAGPRVAATVLIGGCFA